MPFTSDVRLYTSRSVEGLPFSSCASLAPQQFFQFIILSTLLVLTPCFGLSFQLLLFLNVGGEGSRNDSPDGAPGACKKMEKEKS